MLRIVVEYVSNAKICIVGAFDKAEQSWRKVHMSYEVSR